MRNTWGIALGLVIVCVLAAFQARAQAADWADAYCDAPPTATTQADREAENISRLIIQHAPLYDTIHSLVVDLPFADARAHHCLNGKKLVIFGTSFLQRVRSTAQGTGPYWGWVFVAAHEIGHIWRNHGNIRLPCAAGPRDTYCPCRAGMPNEEIAFNHSLELEADFFAGYVLAGMGASREEALSSVHVLNGRDTCTHPARSKRAESVTRGWMQAKSGDRRGAPRGTAADLAKFELVVNRDIYGGDIREVFGTSIEGCARLCLDNDRCVMFSFDRWFNACFIKSKWKLTERFRLTGFPQSRRLTRDDLILKREPKSTIGIRRDMMDALPGLDPRAQETVVPLRNRAFFDQVTRSTESDHWADCSAACRGDGDKCSAFNFIASSKTCELFEQTDGHYPAPGRMVGYVWVQNR